MSNERKLKILMLEDSAEDAFLIQRILKKENIGFIDERVDTREEFTEAIRRFKPDVVLSDHGLPGFNSKEALKICLKEKSRTPFILVTGTVSDEYAVSCIREGADDYILKSNLTRLPSAILSAVKKRKLEKLKREARHALRQQNNELLKVNKELDNFVYSVSHNLRGPLASVMGLLNIAIGEKDLTVITNLHSMMQSSINKLDDTLTEILEFSKNARNEIQLGEIDWLHLVDSTFHRLEYLDKDYSVDKNVLLHTDIPFYSDGARLQVVINNLLSNALLFRDSTTRRSRISIEVVTSDQQASIFIQDNGIGIPEHVLPKIYEMFFRGHEGSQGSGLGLYIVKEIIAKLRGAILITSAVDEGTRVTITIPNVRACELT
jgi:signal transduction histidine kinase